MTSYSYHLAFDYKLKSLAMITHQFKCSIKKETCTHINKFNLNFKKGIFLRNNVLQRLYWHSLDPISSISLCDGAKFTGAPLFTYPWQAKK